MTITKGNLKKFRAPELKAIMKKHGLKGLSGNKSQLMGRILDSELWNTIKSSENLPVREKRQFSEKQLAAQQKFKDRMSKKKSQVEELLEESEEEVEQVEQVEQVEEEEVEEEVEEEEVEEEEEEVGDTEEEESEESEEFDEDKNFEMKVGNNTFFLRGFVKSRRKKEKNGE